MSASLPRLLRWPLWSWRNLAITMAGVLVVLGLLGRLTSGGPQAGAPARGVEPTYPTAGPTASSALATSPASALAGSGDLAVAFVTAWARPDVAAAPWRAALAPMSTSALRKSMRFTDPARVPATHVVARGSTAHESPGEDVVRVVTDGGTVAVTVVWDGGRWLVDQIGPADGPAAAEPPSVGPTITRGG